VIRVALADDQTLVRQGIRGLLELTSDIRVVAEASDGDEGLRILTTVAVDVALLDVRMPHKTGVELLAALAPMVSRPPCILLTTFDDDAVAIEAIKLGARGFLLKDVSLEQLAEAVRTVAAGGTLINPAVTERVVRGLARLATSVPASPIPVAPARWRAAPLGSGHVPRRAGSRPRRRASSMSCDSSPQDRATERSPSHSAPPKQR
jgi:DNA-binding NarL/FixJ family response regulator